MVETTADDDPKPVMRPTENDPFVEAIEKTTPEDFLDALTDAAAGDIGGPFPGAQTLYCFRGVSDAKHGLVPRTLRADGRQELWRQSLPGAIEIAVALRESGGENRENVIQAILEFGVLLGFCRYVQQSGLPLPTLDAELMDVLRDPNGIRPYLEARSRTAGSSFLYAWPPNDFLPLLALAQHYGLPTRLLDWTRDISTASYFAASQIVEQMANGDFNPAAEQLRENLAVWVFRESAASQINSGQLSVNGPLVMPMPPYDKNPNLQAQRGVFTLWRNRVEYNLCDPRALPDLVRDWHQRQKIAPTKELKFVRIELPKAEAPRLLDKLVRSGCDASRFFPGYAGAARAAKERALIDLLLQKSAVQHSAS